MTDSMHDWARAMWHMPRSLTGDGVRQTLAYINNLLGRKLEIISVPSGTEAYGWTVPLEWNCRDAYISTDAGDRWIDWRQNNLHVIGYSVAIDAVMTRAELDLNLHSLPDHPDAIPYITSYYKERWGFCLTQRQRDNLGSGPFRVRIDSTLAPGVMNYGELILPGETEQEVLLSTYICHPSLANDSLSGIVVLTALARYLQSLPSRRYTYRILFLPETIGSIYYLSQHLDEMRENTVAGFVLTCCGDERSWTYLPSRQEFTLADRVAMHATFGLSASRMPFSERGSDERQWCLAGLPVCLVMRSGFGRYPEYHTSLDDLSVISQKGLEETLALHQEMIFILENNHRWTATLPCEPFLSKYGLYPDSTISAKDVPDILKVLGYCDGQQDLINMSVLTGIYVRRIVAVLEQLAGHRLITRV